MTRPTGRSLLIGGPAAGPEPLATLRRLGYTCVEVDDPYSAMAMLAVQPLSFSSIVLSLNTLFKDELQLIAVVKKRFPNIEIWVARFEGRQAVVEEAMRLGADGFLNGDGLYGRPSRAAPAQPSRPQPPAAQTPRPAATQPASAAAADTADALGSSQASDYSFSEPILSADELRALLDDPPTCGDARQA
jgi:hypothetical protein